VNAPSAKVRVESIDLLRGIVIALMALDHARDFLSSATVNPTDLSETTAPLFLTRWVTHFCAPVFVFLAGASAGLRRRAGKSIDDVSRDLLVRGAFLVVLEATVVHFGWGLRLHYTLVLQVIWALGASMIVLGVLVRLPTLAIAFFGVGLVAFHNLFDRLHGGALGALLHGTGRVLERPHIQVFVGYALVPWVGVMACGYVMAPLLGEGSRESRRTLAWMGAGAIALFCLLRAVGVYGDPQPYAPQKSTLFSLFSFINCNKYPPSLDYLLMTLGPALLFLAAVQRAPRKAAPLVTFGRTPLFFYVCHLYLLQLASIALFGWSDQPVPFNPTGRGFSLPGVYLLWMLALVVLLPACRAYGAFRAKRPRSIWRFV
jgi:uncharacterized membrane protein